MDRYVAYSDEYEWKELVPRAKPITWRDWYSIVRGTYKPTLYLVEVHHLTLKGWDRELKKYYIYPTMEELLYQELPLLESVEKKKPPK